MGKPTKGASKSSRIYCSQVGIAWAERYIVEHPGKSFFQRDGKPITDREHVAYIAGLKAAGFDMIPCAHADESGYCQGVERVKT